MKIANGNPASGRTQDHHALLFYISFPESTMEILNIKIVGDERLGSNAIHLPALSILGGMFQMILSNMLQLLVVIFHRGFYIT
jgi:hypothetical protein